MKILQQELIVLASKASFAKRNEIKFVKIGRAKPKLLLFDVGEKR